MHQVHVAPQGVDLTVVGHQPVDRCTQLNRVIMHGDDISTRFIHESARDDTVMLDLLPMVAITNKDS